MPAALNAVKEALKRAQRARTLGYEHDVYHGTKYWPGPVPMREAGAGKGFDRFQPDSRHDMGIHVGDTPHAAQGIQYHWASFADAKRNTHKSKQEYARTLRQVQELYPNENPRMQEQRALNWHAANGYLDPRVAEEQLRNLFDGAYIMPLKARMQGVIDMPDLGNWADPLQLVKHADIPVRGQNRNISFLYGVGQYPNQAEAVANALPGKGMRMPDPMFRDLMHFALENYRRNGPTSQGNDAWKRTVRDINKDYDVDTWRYLNLGESKPRKLPPRYGANIDTQGRPTGKLGYPVDQTGLMHTSVPQYSYVIFDPDQLRLPWAEFDPAYAGSGLLHKRRGGLVQMRECGCV